MVLLGRTRTVWMTLASLSVCFWHCHLTYVSAHGLIVSPRSRNAVAFEETKWWGATEKDPEPETCPHCLSKGGTLARCGMVSRRNYDLPKNALGGPMPPNVQATYYEGDEIVLDVVLTAHHKGHFEYKACPISPGEVPKQSCFDEHPLTFVKDMLYGGQPDPNFPERAYVAPSFLDERVSDTKFGGMKFSHMFRLPDGLNGDLVLIQWHYITSNSCSSIGYLDYNWPEGWEASQTTSQCKYVPEDGVGSPEQFWNCAEVEVIPRNGGGASQTTTTTTTEASIATTATSTTSATTTTTTLADASPLFFCGSSWFDAASKCLKQCPNRIDSDCDPGERCFADTECTASSITDSGSPTTTTTTTNTPPTVSTTKAYIATTASTTTSSATTTTTTSSNTAAPLGWDYDDNSSPLFCGSSQLDAASKCRKQCLNGDDSVCGPGERCFANTQCTVKSLGSSRCGKNREDAENTCGSTCTNNEGCAEGYNCYARVQCSRGNIARSSGGVGGAEGGSSLPSLHLFAFLFFPALLVLLPVLMVAIHKRSENMPWWWNR